MANLPRVSCVRSRSARGPEFVAFLTAHGIVEPGASGSAFSEAKALHLFAEVNREGSRKGVTDGRRGRRSDDATNSDAPAKKKRSGGGDSEDSEDGEEADDDKDVRDVGAADSGENAELDLNEFIEGLTACCAFKMPDPYTPLAQRLQVFLHVALAREEEGGNLLEGAGGLPAAPAGLRSRGKAR